VKKALSISTTVALETLIGEDGAQLGDFIADRDALDPEAETEQRIVDKALGENLAALPELQRRVLELRFGLDNGPPATLGRVSEVTGLPEHQLPGLISETLETLGEDLESVAEMRAA
jgi:RNA polymerase primary sigma factor